MEYNSNKERQVFSNKSKQEKATHNGVSTLLWGNDCPHVEVPDGWEDHQSTQQLIRKYIHNDFAELNFAKQQLVVFLTKEEQDTIWFMKEDDSSHICRYLYLNYTNVGLCLEVRIRKWNDYTGLSSTGRVSRAHCEYGHSVEGITGILSVDIRDKN